MNRAILGLALAAGVAGPALAQARDPHLDFHSSVTLADGSRISVTGTFRVDIDTAADGSVTSQNEGTVEIEIQPAPPVNGQPPPDPERLRVTGEALLAGRSIDPCWMPAMVLMALGMAGPDDVQRFLGFTGSITRMRGFNAPPDPDALRRALGLLLAQVNSLNPAGAARATRLIDSAFGLEPPPDPDSVCLPAISAR